MGYAGGAALRAAVLAAQLSEQYPWCPDFAILEHWWPIHVIGVLGGTEAPGSSARSLSVETRVRSLSVVGLASLLAGDGIEGAWLRGGD